jgi:Antibiotic biosynthesis monooxygenase
MRDFRLADREVSNLQLATYNLMDPLLAKIRAQLPSETLSFALIVRGEVLKEQLLAFTKLARATQESTQKEPGNLLYRFFFDAQDPLEYVLLESWKIFRRLLRISRPGISSKSLKAPNHSPESDSRSRYFRRSRN